MAKTETAVPRLQTKYAETIRPALMEQFGYSNSMAVPRLAKVVLNMGVGLALQNSKRLEAARRELATIAGQQPIITRARRSIAGFKLREGNPIGCKVTLRRQRMYEFLDRLITIAVPRIRDFRGLSPNAFDGRGNYAMGLTEQVVFPEVNPDRIEFQQGLNICIVTTADTDQEAFELLKGFGFPFRGTTPNA